MYGKCTLSYVMLSSFEKGYLSQITKPTEKEGKPFNSLGGGNVFTYKVWYILAPGRQFK